MKLSLSSIFKKDLVAKNLPCNFIELKTHRLSAANVDDLCEVYSSSFEGVSRIVVEMDNVRFIDSSGLGFLVGMRKTMAAPQTVIIEGLTDPVLIQLFSLTRMDQVFYISPNRAATIKLLN